MCLPRVPYRCAAADDKRSELGIPRQKASRVLCFVRVLSATEAGQTDEPYECL